MKHLAAGLLSLLLILACGQRKGPDTPQLNRLLTNEMSEVPELQKMDRELERFMQRWNIRGLSLCVMRNDSLLYAKGYGWADKEKELRMEPGNILRVASVSKLITAAGIMKLCEQGRLHLDDPVFGSDGILRDSVFTAAIRDKNYYKITVEQLLRHEAGFSVRGGDPLFNTPAIIQAYGLDGPPDARTLVRLMLRRRLRFQPGSGHEYSNFSYLLLSLIIEQVTGETYEQWMQENVLRPAGCHDFHLAGNYYKDRHKGEVRYYMQDNDEPVPEYNGSGREVIRCYGGNDIRGLQGAGAWVASTPELALFIASIDGRDGIPDILSRRSVQAMTEHKDENRFGLGWNETDPAKGLIRTGSLSGTGALIHYYADGTCWILVTNTGTWKGPRFARYTKELCRRLKTSYGGSFPKRNLFFPERETER